MKDRIIKIICILLIILYIHINLPLKSNAKFNMSYLYGNYNYISLVERTNGTLNEVSPSYFDLNADGTLKLNKVDKNLIENMHQKGITVVPFLSNHWARATGRNALSNRKKLVEQIVDAINTYNLDGINVDLENLTELDRDNYTDLVRMLREKLPLNKTVSVAVAANPNSWNTGWHGSYDYEALGKYSDYIMIMTYDEHYEGGIAGPVASINFVENSIKYALKYVPNEKIVLGIPFFGRYWQEGKETGGYGVKLSKIDEIIKKYSSVITYDMETESVKATVTIKKGDEYPVINGKTLGVGNYIFWYENEKSITKKLELINKYNLKGSGSWSLGQETADTWNYYKYIIGEDFDNFFDVPDTYWAKDEIYYAKENNWIEGKTQNMFEPETSLTRAEFATLICRVLGYNVGKEETIYMDVNNHWASGYINVVSKAGIMNGYGNGIFKPDENITREETIKVLSYLINDKYELGLEFTDVLKTRWSYKFIEKMSGLGLVKGYENGYFMPENPIKRSEIITILYRMFA